MSATNTTTNLGLSQFVNTDVPAWRQDYNGDMLKIDNAYTADISGATAETSADPSDYMKFYDVSATTNKKILISDLLKGAKVEDLTDTDITTPVDDDGLVYNSTSQKWENVPIVTQEMQDILGAKNLLPNTASTMVDSGVTFTVNSDGTIQTSDTASDTTFIDLPVPRSLGGRVVKLSGCPIGGAYGKYRCICMADGTDIANDIGNGSTFTIPNNFTSCVVRCLVYTGYGNGLTFKPMITLASQPNSDYAHYVPYAKTNRELTNLPNNLGASVDLTGYTSENNMYEFPSDGYIRYAIRGNQSGTVVVYGNNEDTTGSAYLMFGASSAINATTTTVLRGSVYVRKGMKAYCSGTVASADFITLK